MRKYLDIHLPDRSVAVHELHGEQIVRAGRHFIAKTLLSCGAASVDPERNRDGGHRRRQNHVACGDRRRPSPGDRAIEQRAQGIELAETPEREGPCGLFSGPREVAVVSPEVPRDQPHRGAKSVGTQDQVKARALPTHDHGGVQLALPKYAQHDGLAVWTQGIEGTQDHAFMGHRPGVHLPRP